MADILFVLKDPRQAVAGAIERIHVSIPWMKQKVNQQGQGMVDQYGRPMMIPDAEMAWKWVKSQGFHFPSPQAVFQGIVRNPFTPPDHGPPIVLCFQLSPPSTSETFVNAGQPDAQMVGNGNGVNMPPIAGKQTNWGGANGELRRADPWEQVHESGVSRTQDSMVGENDPQGGTFTDVSPLDNGGQERQRSLDPRQAGGKPKLTPDIVWGFAATWYADGYDRASNKPKWRGDPQSAYAQAYRRLVSTGQYDLT